MMPHSSRSLPVVLTLLAACGDDSVGLDSQSSGGTSSTTAVVTTTGLDSSTTAVPTTGETSAGSGSISASTGDTSTGEPATTTGEPATTTAPGTTTTIGDTSSSTGTPAVCGDGLVEDPELCDDGQQNADAAACKLDCTPNTCGDGALFAGVEACDDGNDNDGDGCTGACTLEVCGDGILEPALGEVCDDGNVAPDDGCGPSCQLELCGDTIVQPGLGETCDDGNILPGDGCDATCKLESMSLCAPGTLSVLTNEGFEAGVFPPWTSNGGGTKVVMQNVHEGLWAAETLGNFHVQQTFPAVPVTQLTAANFWTWHSPTDQGIMSVEWGYADNTTGSTFYGSDQLMGWQNQDILALLAPAKSLVWLRVWGYSGGGPEPDIAHQDEFRLCRKP